MGMPDIIISQSLPGHSGNDLFEVKEGEESSPD